MIAERKWWTIFELDLGVPCRIPESYWSPALGHYLHLRPSDMADLTYQQLFDCYQAIEAD